MLIFAINKCADAVDTCIYITFNKRFTDIQYILPSKAFHFMAAIKIVEEMGYYYFSVSLLAFSHMYSKEKWGFASLNIYATYSTVTQWSVNKEEEYWMLEVI